MRWSVYAELDRRFVIRTLRHCATPSTPKESCLFQVNSILRSETGIPILPASSVWSGCLPRSSIPIHAGTIVEHVGRMAVQSVWFAIKCGNSDDYRDSDSGIQSTKPVARPRHSRRIIDRPRSRPESGSNYSGGRFCLVISTIYADHLTGSINSWPHVYIRFQLVLVTLFCRKKIQLILPVCLWEDNMGSSSCEKQIENEEINTIKRCLRISRETDLIINISIWGRSYIQL